MILLEKTNKIGESTEMSWGGFWIPNNPLTKDDSFDVAFEYSKAVVRGRTSDEFLKAFLKNGQEMVNCFEQKCFNLTPLFSISRLQPKLQRRKNRRALHQSRPF
ncbi:hypothetical protein B9Q02_11045 [Candidatus Marsarchaeota G1 archaeon BE_D]|uniref:FAD-dependent oxidoreductase 2 FAD-binding domain-containing protein n=1 Tax=Candidatus Marsarchaeota G1 archaeon BE_D TaxID=1978156 RepID=A0A2R6A992_9ARCH|nr:MAG: hypothetical protein B9Q02_11045 [Candidatus Marsarchaeota G1 archaeon BE_D]